MITLFKTEKSLLVKYLQDEISLETYAELIDALIESREDAISFCNSNPLLFGLDYIYEPNEDILGLIYISCKNIGNRKATGSYYTPTKVVKNLFQSWILQTKIKYLIHVAEQETSCFNYLTMYLSTKCTEMILTQSASK